MTFGVYKIENIVNGKVYVGGTVMPFEKRWSAHKGQLGRNQHSNHYLQEDWDKCGEGYFSFSVLEVVDDKSAVLGCEQKWLNEFLASNREVYNIKVSATAPAYGQDHRPKKTLSDEDVAEIRDARQKGALLHVLAERFGVSESAISRICNNKTRTKSQNREVSVSLHLDNELYKEIKRLADVKRRSVNNQILYWLGWIVKNPSCFARTVLQRALEEMGGE